MAFTISSIYVLMMCVHGFSGDDVNSFESRINDLLASVPNQQTFCDLQTESLFR